MSAPRKIWAHGLCMGALGKASTSVASYRHGSWETRQGDTNYASLYHHDDVVRELRKIEAAYVELIATVRGECPSLLSEDSGGGYVLLKLVDEADAALAKIAQEG